MSSGRPGPRPVERWTAKGAVTAATTMQITAPPAIGLDRHDGVGPRAASRPAGKSTGLPGGPAAGPDAR